MKYIFPLIILLLSACTSNINNHNIIDDYHPPSIGTNYYQLIQYDFDGNYEKHKLFIAYLYDYNSINSRILNTYSSIIDGLFNNPSTWSNNLAPYTNSNNNIINIYNSVIGGDLIFKNNTTINVKNGGTLIVDNININKTTSIIIDDGGSLIIKNDLIGNNNLLCSANGIIAIGGDLNIGTGTINNFSDNFYICGSSNQTLNNNLEKSCDDLLTDYVNFYDVIFDTNLPITILYQSATIYDDFILIEFETASEINSSFVLINWSPDGYNWFTLDTLSSFNKPSYYSYKHLFKK